MSMPSQKWRVLFLTKHKTKNVNSKLNVGFWPKLSFYFFQRLTFRHK